MIEQKILSFVGSLRAGSYNRLLLRAAAEEAPEEMTIEIFDLAPIPLYNEDLEVGDGPEPVARLKEAIARADGVLIATPEYQHGISGVLKNALDWASRPAGRSVLRGKPVATMGARGARPTARQSSRQRPRSSRSSSNIWTSPPPQRCRAPSSRLSSPGGSRTC